ncbi:MAG: FtsX-like permease family protein [Steroidobacteraceae bacterium]
MNSLRFAWTALWREWRAGELLILIAALSIAVAALTGVGFLVGRIDAAVALQASEILAGDLRLESTEPIGAAYEQEAAQRGISSARITQTLTVVLNGDRTQLANLFAVGAGYPLRGVVRIADQAFGAARIADDRPGAGEIWADSRLLAALGADLHSELAIGRARFRVTAVLVSRPDQGATFSDLAPSLLMQGADLAKTQLIQPGSRVRYALTFAGTAGAIAGFRAWLDGARAPRERLQDVRQSAPQVSNSVERAGRFLSLASLVAVLLAGVAVAMAARRYVQRHLDAVALMKTLGATRRYVLVVALWQLIIMAAIAIALGAGLGFAAQTALLYLLRDLFATALPPATPGPLLLGAATAVAVLCGFALPPQLQLTRVPAIRVLRRDSGPPPPWLWAAFLPALAAVVSLIYVVLRDTQLAAGFVAGMTAFALILVAAGLLLLRLSASLRSRVGIAWRYGLANLARRRAETLLQLAAFGFGLSVLLLLGIVRGELLEDWRRSLPADTPNYFFINIPPTEKDALQDYLQSVGARTTRMLPMIRARLTAINGVAVEERPFGSRRGEGFASREQNITWAAQPGEGNQVIAGSWWSEAQFAAPLVSLASEFQEGLGVGIGDQLTFDVAGEIYEVRVASIRRVKWDSFQPNFFIVFPPRLLQDVAGTWMTSAYYRPSNTRDIANLVRRFPSVSIFDMADLLGQVRRIIDKAALAVQAVFLFTMFAGLTVLLAAVQASREERRFEAAILRTLGASRATILRGVLAEFLTLGALAGCLAAAAASVGGYVLARRILDLHFQWHAWVWVAGIVGGAVIVGAAGFLATRSAVARAPLLALRAG